MGVAAPVIEAEMDVWVGLGGGNSGIVGDAGHTFGFHVAADELTADDYSRWRDPNGADGPYVNWDYACAGDFSHKNDPALRAYHVNVLARLMRGELPMICEFIGQPWADRPVYYWARWNGVRNLCRYTGAGHDHWSHISWYRSTVDQPAGLWSPGGDDMTPEEKRLLNNMASVMASWGAGLASANQTFPDGTVQGLPVDGLYKATAALVNTGGGGLSEDQVRQIVRDELDKTRLTG